MLKEKQKTEAIERMRLLKLDEGVIKEFEEESKLNKSESVGYLYWLNDEEKKMVEEWEEETGNLVYHVRFDETQIGPLYSLFYVSKHEEEWEMDREDIKYGTAVVYVVNKMYDYCSEYGSIAFRSEIGGVVRTS